MMGIQRKGVQSASRLAFAVHVGIVALLAAQMPVQAANKISSAVQQEFIAFHIPAQPLDKAVLIFAEQAGLQVLFDSQMLRGLNSVALNGDLGVQEGLARLLGNNPVEYRFTGERQITLTRVSGEHNGALALGTTSVTASEGNTADWVYQTPEGVSVITSEQINKRAPRHTADMLEETPGVYTAVDQRDPGLSVNIRGLQDYGRVNMNVDGMRQDFSVNGHQHRNGVMLIDPQMISSIEIDKGTQSGMGGAAVLGGIATFKTIEASDFLKDGKEFGGRIRAGSGIGELGNGTYFNGGGVFAIGNDIGDALFAYSERHFGNYRSGRQNADNLGDEIRVKKTRREAWNNWLNNEVGDAGSVTRSQMVKFGLNLPNDQRVQLSYLNTDSDSNDSWTYAINNETDYDYVRHSKNNLGTANFGLDYSFNPDNELIDFKAKLYYVTTELVRSNAGHQTSEVRNNYDPYKDYFRTDTWGLQGENTSRFNFDTYGLLSWNYGLEMYQDTFKPKSNKVAALSEVVKPYVDGADPSGKRTMASLFSNLEYNYNDWLTLNGGLRYDRYRLEGKTGMTLYRQEIIRYEDGVPIVDQNPAKRVEDTYDLDEESGQFSPTFGLAIKPGVDWLQLYARWGKGWRPPAVTEVLMTGRPHGGNAPERVFPNPFLKAEESRDWEVGFNIFKESLFFNNDRLGVKVSYFDNRIKNFTFMQYGIALPEASNNFGDLAYVNNLNDTRFRGLEYQLNYDMGRAYTNLSYTHMIGANDFCANDHYLGGAKKTGKILKSYLERYVKPDGTMGFRKVSEYEYLDDDKSNSYVACGGIMGSAAHMPADRGSLTVGARFLERRLDTGIRLRYSRGNGADMNAHNYYNIEQATWPKYSVYDLYASYWPTNDVNLTLVLENATDEAYFVAMGDANNLSLARGRTLSGMLEYKF
ncbi:ligand-gated channel [Pseudomonas fragi]|uniref:Ligand-gated channel n=1 Tax=Pseudomonas fragi TaxID=296 RepID=A0A266LPV9_PSEFR|nr:TonB-dependent receptor [Pseudomonas fragi]OZY40069.1 ligand-gated channel [Pseudomonas fragi]